MKWERHIRSLGELFHRKWKNLWKGINPHGFIECIYIICAMCALLNHVYVSIYLPSNNIGALDFSAIWVIAAIAGIILGRMWRDNGFWLLTCLFAIKVARIALIGQDAFIKYKPALLSTFYAYFCCYSAGRAAGRKHIGSFVWIFCALWTLAMVALSGTGIYVAWTGTPVKNIADRYNRYVRVSGNRLQMIYHWVESGMLCSVSIAVAMVAFQRAKCRYARAAYAVAALVILVAGTLTATRSAYVMTAFEVAFLVCLKYYDFLRERNAFRTRCLVSGGKLVTLFLLLLTTITMLQPFLIRGFNSLRSRGTVIVSQAKAEKTSEHKKEILNRPVNIDGEIDTTLNGRTETWAAVIETIQANPEILLYGVSMDQPMRQVNELLESKGIPGRNHTHNVYLQTLLENGIFALVLYLLFIFYFLSRTWRVIKDGSLPFWQRVLPLPALGCLIGELVDITTYPGNNRPQMTIMYLFIGLTICLSQGHTDEKPELTLAQAPDKCGSTPNQTT